MPQYRVTLKRVTYAEVVIEANSAKEARKVATDDAHDLFVISQISGIDTTTVASVKPEKSN